MEKEIYRENFLFINCILSPIAQGSSHVLCLCVTFLSLAAAVTWLTIPKLGRIEREVDWLSPCRLPCVIHSSLLPWPAFHAITERCLFLKANGAQQSLDHLQDSPFVDYFEARRKGDSRSWLSPALFNLFLIPNCFSPKNVFVWKEGRERMNEYFPSIGLFSKYLQRLGLNQIEVRSQELYLDILCG